MGVPRQLDILALEPFYGGVRKQTLDLLARCSRHRWSVFKLPARRIERRLNTAAQWFSQQISRSPGLKCDVLFTSDAMNLADFLRLNPEIARKPSVAYCYGNQFAGDAGADQQARMALLATATSSTELWFDSLYHMREFLSNAAAVYDLHAELGGKQPLRKLVAKSQLLFPPVEIVPPARESSVVDAERKGRTICLDNREGVSNEAYAGLLQGVVERHEPAAVLVIGRPLANVPSEIPVAVVDVKADADVIRTLRHCEVYISAHPCDTFDALAMRAMALGCIPILPQQGFYSEFLPQELRSWCLYDGSAEDLLSRVMDLWYLRRPSVARRELDAIFARYTPVQATRAFDSRLEYLADQAADNGK